jgi:MoaA/NifB/PqqE/SkfB family radical SAM enzyme
MTFEEAPLLVIWETTQACHSSGVGGRTSDFPFRSPSELTTHEGLRLIEEVRLFGQPRLMLTGGDALKRPDIFTLLRRSVSAGLPTGIIPTASPLLTTEAIDRLYGCGVERMSIALDGADPQSHDSFCFLPGAFERTLAALRHARAIGLNTEIQTTVTRRNWSQLPWIAEQVAAVNGKTWSLLFLISAGQTPGFVDLRTHELEQVFETIYDLTQVMPFAITTSASIDFRQYVARRFAEEESDDNDYTRQLLRRLAGLGDDRSSIFISHTGEIHPSGFIPLSAGNVRNHSLVSVYRNSPLFRGLRDRVPANCDFAPLA